MDRRSWSQAISGRVVVAAGRRGRHRPLAAWLVRHMTPRLLGAAVGGLIVITNVRTLFSVAGTEGETRLAVYAALALVWLAALIHVVAAHRRTGLPLLHRADPGRS